MFFFSSLEFLVICGYFFLAFSWWWACKKKVEKNMLSSKEWYRRRLHNNNEIRSQKRMIHFTVFLVCVSRHFLEKKISVESIRSSKRIKYAIHFNLTLLKWITFAIFMRFFVWTFHTEIRGAEAAMHLSWAWHAYKRQTIAFMM